ncbi:nucleotide-binding universal stress UspA family protein [Tenacibaculum gallaicum]|uniref:Nucleotide-binding universal stress UspA family protein n=1 Tax=Tenacibaculum gallaicum TaxID=561505 RepID=A0A3E0I948_9FLAO|nr:universal stress protein [Tenacibaculum gallaicum]REH54675.1 nucleotide-binding universal stress UspA family protein [Tenacibaculum gallaicum]
MKNILIPYNFSEVAINALNYTKQLFKDVEATIYLLDVYISQPSELLSDEENEKWFNEMDNEIEDELKYLIDVLRREDTSFKYDYIVASNSLTKAVTNTIKEKDIDVVITGTKGAKSLTEIFIGTNTMKIINAVNECPILVVPMNYKYKALHQIVFSTNYKRTFTVRELQFLVNLTTIKKSLIEVVNLSEESFLSENQQRNKVKLRELLQELNVVYKKLDWKDSETLTLENHIEETESELLVLINHKYNFFNRLLDENVIKKSAFNSKIPLLILPEIV